MRSHRFAVYVGSTLLALAILLLGAKLTPFWPGISFALKHTPLCMAENAGWLAPRRAHYSSAAGETVDVLRCAPEAAPRHFGQNFAHPLVVVSDLGGLVQRFERDGSMTWQRKLNMPRGIELDERVLYVSDGRQLHLLDLRSGAEIEMIELPDRVLALKRLGSDLLVLHGVAGAGALVQYRLDGGRAVVVKRFATPFQHARGVEFHDGVVFVADTFGHRVVSVDHSSGEVLRETPSYFPNSVQWTEDSLLVAEEHLNSVTRFSAPAWHRTASEIGCHTTRGKADLQLMQVAAEVVEPGVVNACYVNSDPLANDLYSPNDAYAVDGFVYVVDGDNHRVVVFHNNTVWGALTGFNSPVNVRAVSL